MTLRGCQSGGLSHGRAAQLQCARRAVSDTEGLSKRWARSWPCRTGAGHGKKLVNATQRETATVMTREKRVSVGWGGGGRTYTVAGQRKAGENSVF